MDNSDKKGEVLFAEGKFDEARQVFLEAVKVDPENKEGFNNLGVIAVQQRQNQEAIDLFMKSLAVDPAYLPAVENLCQLLEESGKISEALPLLEPLAQKKPENSTVRKLLLKARRGQTAGPITAEGVSSESEASLPVDARSMYRQAAQAGAGDLRPWEAARELPDIKLKIAVLCLPGLESFLGEVTQFLSKRHEVTTVISSEGTELTKAIKAADTVWLEWANDLTVALTNQPALFKNKRVICRLHSYEAFAGYASKINWDLIDDLIFVGEHIREHLVRQVPDLSSRVTRIHVVPTGVDLDQFPLTVRQPGKRLAYLGYINYKKGPMLLLHALAELVRHDSQYQLFMAGQFQDDRYPLYFSQMASELGIERNLHFDGWVEDVSTWLEDKQYIVSSSILESQGMGILQGMARGLKPIVHNFVGAETVYPREHLWSSIGEFVHLVTEPEYDSASYREFVAANYPKARQMRALDSILRGKMVEGYRPPTSVITPAATIKTKIKQPARKRSSRDWSLPEQVFSTDLNERLTSLVAEAGKQLTIGEHRLAEVSLNRLARMTGFADENIIKHLTSIYRQAEDIPAIRQIWKRSAIAALEKGNLDQFLEHAYLSGYAENLFASEPNYNFCDIDHDLNSFVRLAAKSHSLNKWIAQAKKGRRKKLNTRPKKLKVGFVLEGFSQNQAASRTYFPIAESYDREKYKLSFYSRWFLGEELAKREKYADSVELFQQNGCGVCTPPERLSPSGQVEFLAKNIVEDGIDILIFQTTSFVPQYNFLSALHTAPFQGALEHQQPEYSAEMDILFTTKKQYPESLCRTAPFVMAITRENRPETISSTDRAAFGIPESALLLTSVNRALRYSQPVFWQELEELMTKYPNSYFLAIGLDNLASAMPDRQIRIDSSVRQRIITPGFRSDVLELLQMADIYVDLFPSGGGSSIVEAMQVGLPLPCFEDDLTGSLFNLHQVSLGPAFVNTPEMILAHSDRPAWQKLMGRLIEDESYRRKMSQLMVQKATDFEPKKVVARFFDDLETAFADKMILPSK